MNARFLNINKIVGLCLFGLLATGCNESKPIWNADKTATALASESGDLSEAYANKAALMMTSATLPSAVNLVEKALVENPANKKALFLRAILRPVADTKGIFHRVKGLKSKATNEQQFHFSQIEKRIKEVSVYKEFLLDQNSGPIFESEEDVLNYISELKASAIQSYRDLQSLRGESFEMEFLVPVGSAPVETVWADCQIEFNDGDLTIQRCEHFTPYNVIIETADIEVLSAAFAGMALHYTAASAYSVDGAFEVARISRLHPMSPKNIVRFLEEQQGFGKIRGNGFADIISLGEGIISGAKWLAKTQSTLCPTDIYVEEQRQGRLFSSGICLVDKNGSLDPFELAVSTVESAFQGNLMRINLSERYEWVFRATEEDQYQGDNYNQAHGGDADQSYDSNYDYYNYEYVPVLISRAYTTVASVGGVLRDSPRDLKALFPSKFNTCGNIEGFKDPSMAGVLPLKDAMELFRYYHDNCN